ncbi:MAG: dicarboxylate/amino acid:cation symporter [Tenacibaculum sp.]|nr:dicarboxylate/amino acid:cation symporter [Tenacibaculum sp.]
MKKSKIEILTLLGIVMGVILGIFVPSKALYFKFLGDIFISLLKVLILPIIVLSLFLAITQISSVANLKKLGKKTIIYYLTTSVIAAITGIVLANIFIFKTKTPEEVILTNTKTGVNFIERIFSTNIVDSLAKGEILHIVVFTILFSVAFINLKNDKKQFVINGANVIYETIMKLIAWVLKLAPLGVLSLVWYTIANFKSDNFKSLIYFFIATGIAAVVHSFVSLPLIAKLMGNFNAFSYFLKVKQAVLISFVTASSSASLPVSTKVVEDAGVSKETSQFVLPIGATLNMDGSALYQALLAMLFVTLSGIDISFTDQILLFLFIVSSSAGTAGVPSGGIVMMTMVINMFNIPNAEYYLGLYIMVDRFWDYPITSINVWSDLIGAKTVDNQIKNN